MLVRRVARIASLLMLLPLLSVASVGAGSHLEYKDRGDRHEGVRRLTVSAGDDIELISVLAAYREEIAQPPTSYKVKFSLQTGTETFLTVRELDYEHYYWLHRVGPRESWRPGYANVFEWPTREVVRHLQGLSLYDLGVIVRLGYSEPKRVEKVAPAILYHDRFPATVGGYWFTLETRHQAGLRCFIYREGEEDPVWTENRPRQQGRRPFTLRWDSSAAAEGAYRLVIDGYALSTNQSFGKTVHFYHRPVID